MGACVMNQDLSVDNTVLFESPRARARFVSAKEQAKDFIKKKRKYRRPDFPRMILDLRNLGWSHEKIAFVLDVKNSSTVSAWATGSKPFFEHGEQFIELWRDQTKVDRVPRIGELDYHYEIGQLGLGIPRNQIYFYPHPTRAEVATEQLHVTLDTFAEQIGLNFNE